MRFVLLVILMALALITGSGVANASEKVSGGDRFALWNECRPIRLLVEGLSKDAGSFGLTEDSIEVAVRSRLRGARLFTENRTDSGWSRLYVRVSVLGNSFSIELSYMKLVEDQSTGLQYTATTWDSGSVGTHGKDENFILGSLRKHTDKFIDEYLRVNNDAC